LYPASANSCFALAESRLPVGLAGCDKSLPGLMIVVVRLNLPSVFLPGRFKGKTVAENRRDLRRRNTDLAQ
jgi:dihydroxyacid dehydratase/phosphogluconate dehydratase